MSVTSTALIAPADKKEQSLGIVSQEYGAFEVKPFNDQLIRVSSKEGVLIDGLLYPFSASLQKLSTGTWHFLVGTLNLPKLAPKKRTELLEKLTFQVNRYLEEHPEIWVQIKAQAWVKNVQRQADSIRSLKVDLVQRENSIINARQAIEERHQLLRTAETELTTLRAEPPEGAVDPLGEVATVEPDFDRTYR